MVDKRLPIKHGDKIIIADRNELLALGYAEDYPEMLDHASKAYTVKAVARDSKDLRHVHVCEVPNVFIDADIASVVRAYPL